MNRYLTLACLGLISALALASPSPARAGSKGWRDLSVSQRRWAMQVIRCSRDLAEKGGEFPGATLAAESLQQLVNHLDDVGELRTLARTCETAREDLFSGKMEQQDPGFARQRERDAEWLALPNFPWGAEVTSRPLSDGVKSLIFSFLDETKAGNRMWNCSLVGPEVIAALGIGFEAGVKGGVCTARDGRRWLAVGGSAGVVFGIGAMAGVRMDGPTFDGAGDADFTFSLGAAAGPGIVLKGDSAPTDPESATFGVGLGVFLGLSVDADVRLIPIGDARRKLVGTLLTQD